MRTRALRLKKNQSVKSALSRKERLAEQRKRRMTQQKAVGTILSGLFIGICLGLPIGLITSPKYGLMIAVSLPSFLFSYQYPRLALWTFLIYLPLSGSITYWLGGGNAAFQLAKDVFYLPALVALLQECRRKRQPIVVMKQLLPTLTLVVVFCLLTYFLVNGFQQNATGL